MFANQSWIKEFAIVVPIARRMMDHHGIARMIMSLEARQQLDANVIVTNLSFDCGKVQIGPCRFASAWLSGTWKGTYI
jgi:hypothetical protein